MIAIGLLCDGILDLAIGIADDVASITTSSIISNGSAMQNAFNLLYLLYSFGTIRIDLLIG